MPTAFSYVRFSSRKQATGASRARQRDMVARWITENPEFKLSEANFEDLGVSGYSGKHLESAFGRLLAAIENEAIKAGDVILVEAIDRAGRLEPLEMLPIISQIVRAGVAIITLDDGVTYDRKSLKENNLFLLVAKIQQAHQYSDRLSGRVRDALARKREKAKAGEKIKRRSVAWLNENNELIPGLQPLIQSIFEDYAAGIGERRILNRVRGKHPLLENLNPTTIKRWLRNKAAVGTWSVSHLRDGNGELPSHIPDREDIPGVFPPVVSEELFFRVQKRLQNGQRLKAASAKYLLSGLVVCGACGSNFGVVNTKKSPPQMLCMNRHRLGVEMGCSNSRSLPMQVLEAVRFDTCLDFIKRAMQGQKLSVNDKRLLVIEQSLRELHGSSERLADVISEFGADLPALSVKLRSVAGAIAELEKEKSLLQASTEAPILDWDAVEFEDDMRVESADTMKLNALLRGAGYKITCNDRMIKVDSADGVTPPRVFEYLRADRKTNKYRVVWDDGREYLLDIPNGKSPQT
ncbi:recombinase family protein [Pseudomonas segetis]